MDLQTILSIVLGSSFVTIVLGWFKDIYFSRREEQKRRLMIQEEIYRELMRCSDFIYDSTQIDNADFLEKKKLFFQNYRLSLLYAPDNVISAINKFLDIMTSIKQSDDPVMVDKKIKIAQSILTLRKQFIKCTKLSADDYRHIV